MQSSGSARLARAFGRVVHVSFIVVLAAIVLRAQSEHRAAGSGRAAVGRRVLEARSTTPPSAAARFIPTTSRPTRPGTPRSRRSLAKSGPHGGAYLGVGPEQNFNYIAAIRPAITVIFDIRQQAVMQHLLFKALFELSANTRRVHFAIVFGTDAFRRGAHSRNRRDLEALPRRAWPGPGIARRQSETRADASDAGFMASR